MPSGYCNNSKRLAASTHCWMLWLMRQLWHAWAQHQQPPRREHMSLLLKACYRYTVWHQTLPPSRIQQCLELIIPKRLRKMFVNCPPWILKIARMIQLKFAKILWNCNQYRQCLPTIRSDACPQAQVSHQVPRSLVHCASLCPMMIQWWPSMAEAVTRRGAVSCMSRKYKDKSLLKHVHYIYTHINIYIYMHSKCADIWTWYRFV